MSKRSIEDRVQEQEQRLELIMKKLQQEKERLKQLRAKSEDEARKHRNHMLIVCGAEIASLYDFSFLEEDEICKVVKFLKESRNKGVFAIEKHQDEIEEKGEVIEETQEEIDESVFGTDFLF